MASYLFIESNTTGTGALALGRLLDQGHRVTFLTRRPALYPFLAPRPGLEVIAAETNEAAALGAAVDRVRGTAGVDAVVTFSEYYVAPVAVEARRLGLPALDPAAARTCRSKLACRRALRDAGAPTPPFWAVGDPAAARRAGREARYPCVVKPTGESSSQDVLLVEDAAALEAHCRHLLAQRHNARGQPLAGEALVEGLLEGPEVSVETVTLGRGDTRVVAITAKHLSPPPRFVELGHDLPAALDPASRAAVTAATRAALDAVGYDFGPAHTELRLTARGPVVVEINPRLAGGLIPELVRHATGVDLLAALLAMARGEAPALDPERDAFAAIRFLVAPRHGRLAGARGLAAAGALATVQEATLVKPAGVEVWPAEHALHRLGHVLAAGDDRRRVLADLAAAQRAIQVTVDAMPRAALAESSSP